MDSRTRTALSRAIVWDIVETSVYRRSNMIMAYASFGSELQTDEFLRHVLDQGKILLLPRVNRQRELLEVYWVQDPVQDLQVGTWGYASLGRIGARAWNWPSSTSCWFPVLRLTGGADAWATVEASTTNCWRKAYRRARGWSPVHSRARWWRRFP